MPRCGLEPDRSEPCSILSSVVLLFSRSSALFVTRPYLMLRKKVQEPLVLSVTLLTHTDALGQNCELWHLFSYMPVFSSERGLPDLVIGLHGTHSVPWSTRAQPTLHRIALTFSTFVSLTKVDFCGLPGWKRSVNYCYPGGTLGVYVLNRIYDRIIFNPN